MQIINIPKQYTYLSQVPEFKDGFPANSFIDKGVTGCGGTHLALTSSDPYVVAVHAIRMITSKTAQDKYKHVLPVTGETPDTEIKEYLKAGGTKILVTYDSVPKVQSILGEQAASFRLLVDEVHKLLQYMDKFKTTVSLQLIERSLSFKDVVYLTATPTDPKWLPSPLKELNYIRLQWASAIKPNISHSYVPNNLTNSVLHSVLDVLDNTKNEAYIFYNSKRSATTLVKRLLKCKPSLGIEDINILFAETPENTSFFSKNLKGFSYGEFPDGTNNKRINIISSMGFEGSDFIPNVDENIEPISFVVSDPSSKSMRFDISIDFVQIAGRFRAHPTTGKIKSYPIVYLWNTQKNDYIQSEEECLKILRQEENDSKEMITFGVTNAKQSKLLNNVAKTQEDRFIIEGDNDIAILHPYGVEVGMSCYHAMHSDAYVLNNVEEGKVKTDSIIVNNLAELDPDLNSYHIPSLGSEYTKLLGRQPSVIKLIEEYEELLSNIGAGIPDARDNLQRFLVDNPDFAEWLDAGISTSNMNTLGRVRSKIDELARSNRRLSNLKDSLIKHLNLEIGGVYAKNAIKDNIQRYYDSKKIKLKAKATTIKEYFKTQDTTVKGIHCVRIIKKL